MSFPQYHKLSYVDERDGPKEGQYTSLSSTNLNCSHAKEGSPYLGTSDCQGWAETAVTALYGSVWVYLCMFVLIFIGISNHAKYLDL